MRKIVFESAPQQGTIRPTTATKRQPKTEPFVIREEKYSKLLDALLELKKLSAEQLTRRFYNAGSLTTVKNRMTRLEEHHFVDHDTLSQGKYLYFLARKGRDYFQEAEEDIKDYFRPSKEKGHANTEHYHQLLHLLELNDILIAARLLSKYAPAYSLPDLLHDYDLRRSPLFVMAERMVRKRIDGVVKTEWKEEPVGVVADAMLGFVRTPSRIPGKPYDRMCIWHEHNRTGGAQRFKQKIRALLEVIGSGVYKQLVDIDSLKVAITTSKGEFRKRSLRRWTEEVLEERSQKEKGTAFSQQARKIDRAYDPRNTFYFATTPPFETGCIVPRTFYQEKVWYMPFSTRPVNLLPK